MIYKGGFATLPCHRIIFVVLFINVGSLNVKFSSDMNVEEVFVWQDLIVEKKKKMKKGRMRKGREKKGAWRRVAMVGAWSSTTPSL